MVTLKEVVSTRQRQIRPSLLHVATSSLEITTKSIETQEEKKNILVFQISITRKCKRSLLLVGTPRNR